MRWTILWEITYRYNLSEPEPERVHKFAKWPQKYFQTNHQTLPPNPSLQLGAKMVCPQPSAVGNRDCDPSQNCLPPNISWGYLCPQKTLSAPKTQPPAFSWGQNLSSPNFQLKASVSPVKIVCFYAPSWGHVTPVQLCPNWSLCYSI